MKPISSSTGAWLRPPRAGRLTALALLVAALAAGALAVQRASRPPTAAAAPSIASTGETSTQSYVGTPPLVSDEAAHTVPPPGEWPAP